MTTTHPPTLPGFLLARIADDEQTARTPGTWLNGHATRALADCQAKRRIVQLADRDDNWRFGIHAEAIHAVLRLLATIWADHPHYRQEWTPYCNATHPELPPGTTCGEPADHPDGRHVAYDNLGRPEYYWHDPTRPAKATLR